MLVVVVVAAAAAVVIVVVVAVVVVVVDLNFDIVFDTGMIHILLFLGERYCCWCGYRC